MAAPPETDLARIRKYCHSRVPARLHDQLRIKATVRGGSVTIFDCRPRGTANLTERSKVRAAQLRYSASTRHWSLYSADRNGRSHRYDGLAPGGVPQVLREIESDPTGIFRG